MSSLTREQSLAVVRVVVDKIRNDPDKAEDVLIMLPHPTLVTLAATMAGLLAKGDAS